MIFFKIREPNLLVSRALDREAMDMLEKRKKVKNANVDLSGIRQEYQNLKLKNRPDFIQNLLLHNFFRKFVYKRARFCSPTLFILASSPAMKWSETAVYLVVELWFLENLFIYLSQPLERASWLRKKNNNKT